MQIGASYDHVTCNIRGKVKVLHFVVLFYQNHKMVNGIAIFVSNDDYICLYSPRELINQHIVNYPICEFQLVFLTYLFSMEIIGFRLKGQRKQKEQQDNQCHARLSNPISIFFVVSNQPWWGNSTKFHASFTFIHLQIQFIKLSLSFHPKKENKMLSLSVYSSKL